MRVLASALELGDHVQCGVEVDPMLKAFALIMFRRLPPEGAVHVEEHLSMTGRRLAIISSGRQRAI